MYMADIKLFAKMEKNWEFDANNKNMQSGYRNGIRHRKMYQADNEKWKKTNNRRNKTTKSRKNQDTWKKWKLQVCGNIGSKHHQKSGDERKNNKRLS